MSKDDLQRIIGIRIKAARDKKGLNQNDLAGVLQLKNHQSISDIENGNRALKPTELVLLSDVLEKDIEYFIDPFSVIGEAEFSWRTSNTVSDDTLASFEEKAGKWIGLLRWMRQTNLKGSSIINYAPKITRKPSYEDAILCAETFVKDFNLGPIPSKNLLAAIENNFDIPVLFVDTIYTQDNNYISGASCHMKDLGVILVNRNEPETRRNFDLAHELFHVITWEYLAPAHREYIGIGNRNGSKKPKVEQLADIFASSLLMPIDSINTMIDKSQLNNIQYLLEISSKFIVSPTALGWRLYNLHMIDKELVHKLEAYTQSNGVKPNCFSENFIKMLYASINQGQLSARKAAKAMDLSLEKLKDLFTEYSFDCPFDL